MMNSINLSTASLKRTLDDEKEDSDRRNKRVSYLETRESNTKAAAAATITTSQRCTESTPETIMNDDRAPRTAHVSTETQKIQPLFVEKNRNKIPLKIRIEAIDKLLAECKTKDIQAQLKDQILSKERDICIECVKKTSYLSKIAGYLLELRRNIIPSIDTLTTATTTSTSLPHHHRHKHEAEVIILNQPSISECEEYLASLEKMIEVDFPTIQVHFNSESLEPKIPERVKCDRCHIEFSPLLYYASNQREACFCHDGKLLWPQTGTSRNLKREKLYTCCGGPETERPCFKATNHVYSIQKSDFYIGQYAISPNILQLDSHSLPTLILGLDCEMIYTVKGLELARITLVNWDEEVFMDLLIQPENEIIDYNTRYSGISSYNYQPITEASLADEAFLPFDNYIHGKTVTEPLFYSLEEGRRFVLELCEQAQVIFVGHSLENDLRALKLIHPNVIDTCLLYPHPKGPPYRYGLKTLAHLHLNEFIQQNDLQGHSSIEDARTSLKLFKIKYYKNQLQPLKQEEMQEKQDTEEAQESIENNEEMVDQ